MPNKIPKYLETDSFLPGSEEEMNHVFVVILVIKGKYKTSPPYGRMSKARMLRNASSCEKVTC